MLDRLTGWLGRLFGRRAAPRGGAAPADELTEMFVESLRAVWPDFDRYCRIAGDDAGEVAARTVYASLPPSGKVSRGAVVRELLVRLADEAQADRDAETISSLSERQLAIAARRAGIPI
ncbi:MAG TPA: hypothetical protein VFX49_15420 [Chloroflexota bacterium]|nr:hypothetical protein [Chloroflexota bacterium]